MTKLTVNGRSVEVGAGATLLDAARAAGVHVPTLCWYPRLPSHAVCRMCLVEVTGQQHPQPACVTPAREGDVVATDTPALQAFRRSDAQWLLARHPSDCLHCEVSGSCQLQSLVAENQWEQHWPESPRRSGGDVRPEHADHTSPSIWRELSKCIECGLCVEACGEQGQRQYVIGFAGRGPGRLPVTVFERPLSETNCISCGQCTLVCPVGALVEAPHWHDVLHVLDARRHITAVQVAPATRIAISEEFGMAPGTASTGRLINALRQLGFDHVFDTNFGADLTIIEEAAELLARIARRERLPLFTSCCPGWVNWVEINRPELLPHLSTTKSPQQMHGAITKRGRFARSLGSDYAEGRAEPYVVSVMPCTAKKDEALRPGLSGDLDRVLTTRELARMIRARGIAFGALAEDGQFDHPLGESTGAGQIFAASGGVMEAMARQAAHVLGTEESQPLDWQLLRGVGAGVKSAEVPGVGRVAVCNGIAAAQELLATDAWRNVYVAIEVMACVGGCLGGGGEPKSMDPQILEKRMHAVYELDRLAPRRRSHENREVQQLYAGGLGAPNSEAAHALLHTAFAARHSPRDLLMRFLDCVDRRDGQGAAALFHPEGIWSTASPFGEIRGRAQVASLVDERLPPRKLGPALARHRMARSADEGSFEVITPDGGRCIFSVQLVAGSEDNPRASLISRLVRSECRA
jgi:NADP-reducing hydrogenase subunit HndD